ncbi:hypothetical protein ACP70R_003485 [Stipagrostis hirtigluma subsp. patula]
MSSLSMMEAAMPPGFRFHPRDDELVLDYLLHKLSGRACGSVAIVDVDLNNCEPWDLPEAACVGGKEWYFFSLHDRKYATGLRTNRATRSGYWKATGKDRAIVAGGTAAAVGMRKTLVFYRGRAPKGRKTEWVMHEFRLEQPAPWLGQHFTISSNDHRLKEDWVLCRVFYKSRTTTPRPTPEDAFTTSTELDRLPAAQPLAPLVDTCTAFDDATVADKRASCFSGLPALPFIGPAGIGDLLPFDTSEREAIRTVLSSMSGSSTSGLELAPNWELGNEMSQMWHPFD